jgi:hypothetical protein
MEKIMVRPRIPIIKKQKVEDTPSSALISSTMLAEIGHDKEIHSVLHSGILVIG